VEVHPVKLTKKLIMSGLLLNLAAYPAPSIAHAVQNEQVVQITASKFHFTPDHITLVKNQPVTLQLTSTDATHGFMIRALKIDTDIKRGKVTQLTVTPSTAGTFRAICDHYCGLGHSGMKMTVVVEENTAKAQAADALTASNAGLR
jgi:cytochrome c oxidase subunit 2